MPYSSAPAPHRSNPAGEAAGERLLLHPHLRRIFVGLVSLTLLAGVDGSVVADMAAQTSSAGADTAKRDTLSSRQLIEQAAAKGSLTQEQKVLYKLFALTGDSRLPSAYQGSDKDNRLADGSGLREVLAAFPTLSPPAQAVAAPYFQPPIYPGSWYELREGAAPTNVAPNAQANPREPGPEPLPRTGWKTIPSQSIPIRVWYLEEQPQMGPRASSIGRLIEKAWPMLMGVMGKQPLSDAGPHPFVHVEGPTKGAFDVWGDGGDGRFDIYLLPLPGWQIGGAVTMAYPPGCSERPAFMLVDSRVSSQTLEAAAVHEFMHAIEFAFKVGKDCAHGWDEATAHWALNHVLPGNNFEHESYSGGRACLQYPGATCSSYGAWVFALYLDRTYGPAVIRRSWELMATQPAWRAVNAAVPGGLKKAWPRFALHGWNQPPYPTYEEWDAFLAKPLSGYDNDAFFAARDKHRQQFPDEDNLVTIDNWETPMLPTPIRGELKLDGKLRGKVEVKDGISERLSRHYVRYSLPDKDVRFLRIQHPYRKGGDLSIQALRKRPDSSWVTEDWTPHSEVTICRNDPEEDLTEIVFVFGNAAPDGRTLKPIPHDKTTPWQSIGKATVELRKICPKSFRVRYHHVRKSTNYGVQYETTWNAVLRERDAPDDDGNNFSGHGTYQGIAVDRKANCLNDAPEDLQETHLKGSVRAKATITDLGGDSSSVIFELEPLDSPKQHYYTRSFQSMEDRMLAELGDSAEAELPDMVTPVGGMDFVSKGSSSKVVEEPPVENACAGLIERITEHSITRTK